MKEPVLVCLHGWGVNESLLQFFSETYLQGFSVCCPAMPGYGAQPTKVGDINDVCHALNSQLSAVQSPFILCGWSLGGSVALRYAQLYPHQIQSLVLVCVNPCFCSSLNWPYGVDKKQILSMREQLGDDQKAVLRRFYGLCLFGDTAAKLNISKLTSHYSNDLSADGLIQGLDLLCEYQGFEDLNQAPCPVTAIVSDNDVLVNSVLYRDPRAQSPSISHQIIPGGTHIPFLSRAEQTARHLLQAIES